MMMDAKIQMMLAVPGRLHGCHLVSCGTVLARNVV